MKTMTLPELASIVVDACGVDVDAEQFANNPTITFKELGIDSLGVMNVLSELSKQVKLDDEIEQFSTPRDLLDRYNEMVAGPPGRTENSIVINAELDAVWEITNDLTRWATLFSEYAAVEILEAAPQRFVFRLTMHPDENGNVWSWVSERVMDPEKRTVLARRVETGPFEYMNIRWDYTAVEEGTFMRWRQDFRMRPDAPLTTQQMADRINQNTVIQMGLIKRRIEAIT